MKSKRWYIKWPGDVYAQGPVNLQTALNEKDLREYIRYIHNLKRLPRGFECWPTHD